MTEPTRSSGVPSGTSSNGRRAVLPQRRRVDLLTGLAVGLPALVVAMLVMIGAEDTPSAGPQAPTVAPLAAATVVCPSGTTDASEVTAARVPGVDGGDVTAAAASWLDPDNTDAAPEPVTIDGARTGPVPLATPVEFDATAGATVLRAEGTAAPGLVAGRRDALALGECREPSYDEWFVSSGAAARYSTVVELVNPDAGEAVVDLAVHDAGGLVEEPALRGLVVPAFSARRVDLARVAPRAGVFSVHLTVVRGRLTASAVSQVDPLGRGRATADHQPAVTEASEDGLILGLPARRSGTLLTVANPGDDEVRVTPRLVTEDAIFTPTDGEEITVPPHGVTSVSLQSLLADDSAEGVVGIQVEATAPVVSTVRLQSGGDVVLLAPVTDIVDPTAVVLPTGEKLLTLGRAPKAGTVAVVAYDAAGTQLVEERVEVGPGRASRLDLPPRAVLVTVDPRNTTVGGVVTVPQGGRSPGLAALRLLPGDLTARIPFVGPR